MAQQASAAVPCSQLTPSNVMVVGAAALVTAVVEVDVAAAVAEAEAVGVEAAGDPTAVLAILCRSLPTTSD